MAIPPIIPPIIEPQKGIGIKIPPAMVNPTPKET